MHEGGGLRVVSIVALGIDSPIPGITGHEILKIKSLGVFYGDNLVVVLVVRRGSAIRIYGCSVIV